jgi:rRNA-processing protein FCF1
MKKTILDTNFILTCVKQKIDFFEEIKLMGMQILIPNQVINEIKKIENSKQKQEVRRNARLALKILEKNKYKKIDLGKGHVDKKIINYVKNKKDIVVATLDKELKNKITNPKLIIRGRKKILLE